MKISATQTGFALYKEAGVIGRCDVTPTPKGADITALSVLSQWRRKGYGSYLLKEILRRFGGYDREAATVFTAPLPADEGEGLFWQKFGFAPEDGRLVRRRTPDLTAVRFVQDYLAAHLPHPKLCIDATCGNGGDTAFLCRLSGPEGRVMGFDIQPEAITSTRARLEKQGLTAEPVSYTHLDVYKRQVLAAGGDAAHRPGGKGGPGVHQNALLVDEIPAGQGRTAPDGEVGQRL